jgi:hypothetical protein
MLFVIGAMVLLGKLALSTNAFFADNEVVLHEAEAITTATSIGQSVLEKISVRQFDNNYPNGNDTLSSALFVPAVSLGRDAGELAGKDTMFNDIDDFKGFHDSVLTPRFGKFYMDCKVCYVSESSPFDSSGVQTYLKKVEVTVTNSYLVDPTNPLKLSVPLTVSRLIAYD